MKLSTAKCHERATLRKLWRQTGNSSLLPAKCWPLLHVIRACSWRWPGVVAGISARFSKFAFVFLKLFLLYNKSLNEWSLRQQWILFPSNLMEIRGKQNSLFPSGPVIKCIWSKAIFCSWGDANRLYCKYYFTLNFSSNGLETTLPIIASILQLPFRATFLFSIYSSYGG